ncbi:acetyl-CoA C-acyltransferase [Amnimonas aquatica]|uniref:Beta-ketoadipyl-CoA thiolase n=1 Tax=Amnimonas aquatica TaxID=2094561 RepID=A0A2P6ATR5_9GAMM|nr:acetyl-CoA C-acyltransferase [Amnimonas aquatica]PQA48546.1 acetyl-CoA C-acyltransferase [Amnimonas aquatica]
MSNDPVVIVNGARTPMGGFQGALAGVTAPELGAISIRAALERAGVAPEQVQEVIMGCVLPAGLKQGPARQAALGAGIPAAAGATTVNKLCGSGMKATMLAHDLIKAGTNDIMVAGGMESMTNAPYVLPKARSGYRMGHGQVMDHMFLDGLEDARTGRLMGSFAQDMANTMGLTRADMDAFAVESLRRANAAIANGDFKAEIVPVPVQTRKGEVLVDTDEQPGNANPDKIPTLKPAFAKDGSITAANASSISDGASALVLMKESKARELGLKPLARIVGHATQSQDPSEFTIAPIGALSNLFARTGWTADSVDLFEINEAFAMVTMAAMIKHNLPHEKVNVYGGACALGHPVGSTGSRILLTLIHALKQHGKTRGVAGLCIGGGEATAMAIEII